MNTIRLASLLLVTLMVHGCAIKAPVIEEHPLPAYSSAAPLPEWTQSSTGTSQTGYWFVGQGQGVSETVARSQAEEHAQLNLVRYLGADVRATGFSRSETRTNAHGVAHESTTGIEAIGVSSDAYISAGTYSYHVRKSGNDFIVWARYDVPNDRFQAAQQAADKAYKDRVAKIARARELAEKSRHEDVNGLRFALVTGTGVAGFNALKPIQSETSAVARAKNEATMKVVEALIGQNLSTERIGSTVYLSGHSQGRVFHENIFTRVWVLGSEVKAEVTVLGWTTHQ